MRYFKIYLPETRGDEFAFWGGTSFYLEVDDTWYAKRQIESYDNGVILTYDEGHESDVYGMLSDRPVIDPHDDSIPQGLDEISESEFNILWLLSTPINRAVQ